MATGKTSSGGTPATLTLGKHQARSGLDPARVDGAVVGNVIKAGNRMNPARQAALGGGTPVEVPA